MEVVSARSALLSNFEVLTLLRELEAEQLARTKSALLRVKKEEEDERIAAAALQKKGKGKEKETTVMPSTVPQPPIEEVSENLRTVEFEAIQYLSADYQPTARQSDAAITKLVKKLEPYDLTQAEKLQIVNLAPTQVVELYVIVEEIEDRMGDRMDEILTAVRDSLSELPKIKAEDQVSSNRVAGAVVGTAPHDEDEQWDGEGDDLNDAEFDDTGEGAGVEGDLEMDDD